MADNRQPAGVWLHAVTRDADPCGLDGLTGIGGCAVRTVQAGGLVAVVSSVDLAQFGEEPCAATSKT
ncbi:GvpL/GvpF family gas vesicle protein [Dactylosporangium cerinum]